MANPASGLPAEDVDARVWKHLPLELALRVLERLPPNEVACTARLVCHAAARQLQPSTVVTLSQWVPPNEFARHWGRAGATLALSLRQRRRLVALVAASGEAANLRVAAAAAGCLLTSEVAAAAAAAGQVDCCALLLGELGYRPFFSLFEMAAGAGALGLGLGPPYSASFREWDRELRNRLAADPLCAAAFAGNERMCRWLMRNGVEWHESAVLAAGRGGHAPLMELLEGLRPSSAAGATSHFARVARSLQVPPAAAWRVEMLAAAAAGCDVRTLRYLQAKWQRIQRFTDAYGRVTAAAAASPTPDWQAKLDLLIGLGYKRSVDAAAAAAARPDAAARLAFLSARGFPSDDGACLRVAAGVGNEALVRQLLASGVPVSEEAVAAAAREGQLRCLQTLLLAAPRSGGSAAAARVTQDALEAAAVRGHVAVVEWVLAAAPPHVLQAPAVLLGRNLLAAASMSGSLEMVGWLRAWGAGWSPAQWLLAARAGNCAVLSWMLAEGYPLQTDGNAYLFAAWNGDMHTVRHLRALGASWGDFCRVCPCVAAFRNPLRLVAGLVEAGCPLTWVDRLVFAWRMRTEGRRLMGASASGAAAGGTGSAGDGVGQGGGGASGRGAAGQAGCGGGGSSSSARRLPWYASFGWL
ncbi:hypothetical protein HYH02_002239 [Chlamydomonas schloesseri]|uniref:F-box domain-containing protein n=1 Tax=Chlamydomonas schloesseri TaxID=2026947 RepID=A0A835WUU1_9CHLO|nr:hypothetical protein HYH02_002239 [Chlamydomonas schloesseri]|eukprot:KAG2452895.1 hypothetical protein HYH02_002239 [Chlamydomonas schloesseri]